MNEDERDRAIQESREQIAILNVAVLELRAGLCAALAYLHSQPSYDADAMARFHDEQIDKLGIGPGDSRLLLESLREYLASVKGQVQ